MGHCLPSDAGGVVGNSGKAAFQRRFKSFFLPMLLEMCGLNQPEIPFFRMVHGAGNDRVVKPSRIFIWTGIYPAFPFLKK